MLLEPTHGELAILDLRRPVRHRVRRDCQAIVDVENDEAVCGEKPAQPSVGRPAAADPATSMDDEHRGPALPTVASWQEQVSLLGR